MTIKAKDFERIVNKFGLKTRNSGDRLAWFEYEGRTITRTKLSHKQGDLPFQDSIRQQLKLNERQLRDTIRCNFSKDQYIDLLKKKGLI